ncbi:MAG TPA: transcriptional regulator [Caldimonas sp.]|jgi:hypothetical protein|nr:transcriptional regulator [Caldimonas sp.]HEX2541235.1 transcriptional regulator [Caldimonas sp.]
MERLEKQRSTAGRRRVQAINPHLLALPDTLLKLGDVSASLGQSDSSTRRDVAAGLMVPPVRKGTRCARFVSGEVAKVRAARAQGADVETIQALVRNLVATRKVRT